MNPLFRPWRHLFDFRGRASRREFLLFHVGVVVLYIVLIFASLFGFTFAVERQVVDPNDVSMLAVTILCETGVLLLVLLVGHFSVAARRLHDLNRPGVACLLSLVPVVDLVLWGALLALPGSEGENDYGPDPRLPPPVRVEGLEAVFS